MFLVPPEVILFFAVQLPASLALGMIAGVLAVHVAVARRGRVSLRMGAGVVLMAALGSAALAQNPAAWGVMAGVFLLGGGGMALVDLAILLGLDRHRASPRFSPGARRRMMAAIPPGLAALGLAAAAFLKHAIAVNPAAVSWPAAAMTSLGLLVFPALLDATTRVILGKVA